MTGAVPIRPDVEPAFDVERELGQYCAERIRSYVERFGHPPQSIAIVLIGGMGEISEAHSWTPLDETHSRGEACAYAALLLNERAAGR